MPIVFISLNEDFNKIVRQHGFKALTIPIEDYKPIHKTYYVSPANSLCFMDGGIDLALSRKVFPNIEPVVKNIVSHTGKRTQLGRAYLPIGSSLIIDDGMKSLVVSPTMLLPQNVSHTQNAYYATMACLYNILENRREKLGDIDILLTSFCCGYGKMDYEESAKQIIQGIKDYPYYKVQHTAENLVMNEPNLHEQPKFYQNTEWFDISPQEIILT